jgi:hypothetical protein
MTGPEHWREAEKHLTAAAGIETDGADDSASAWHQRQAQVHATLAVAAATANPLASMWQDLTLLNRPEVTP